MTPSKPLPAPPGDSDLAPVHLGVAVDGLDAVLATVCEIEPDGELAKLVKERMPELAGFES